MFDCRDVGVDTLQPAWLLQSDLSFCEDDSDFVHGSLKLSVDSGLRRFDVSADCWNQR